MVHFIGAGPGDPELLTIKGKKLIDQADVIIYAGSLVNKEVLAGAKEGAEIYNSATMTLEEVIEVMKKAEAEGKMTARVHTGCHSRCEFFPCNCGSFKERIYFTGSFSDSYSYKNGR